ncbi:trehalose-phosphatase [Paracidovorax citrulli]|uniref:trehalose-phosphatase n=1 Tax=Paracidovorax citrulli TaxID=80869 RepID=UPI0008884BA1|nr:trehalose-phosphatase [Paracidovorax citrulli]UMT89861.1 trehalose-phosphatase [Paracidovorax citrulli]WIY35354.1 trehalose-phosphatase [Paracidovorax citrulli]SDJ04126.1 trehalose 6-phosphatase [Paracidovorax citrulli]
MQKPPLLTARHALFLDFDGTLADIAPHPDAVQVHPGVVPALRVLHERLEGALAIATGRTQADIDHFLSPLQLPLACEHGAQYRMGNGVIGGVPAPDLAPVVRAVQPLLDRYPALVLERKSAGMALHYRQAVELEPLCRAALEHALAQAPGLELMQGKCVLEIKPSGPNKGRAIADFMRQTPFAGRIPVFAGDDVTDEYGFDAAQALGGIGVKIGTGDTRALARCGDTTELREWLFQMASPEGFPA